MKGEVMRRLISVLGVVLISLSVGCSDDTLLALGEEGCVSDDDCATGLVCIDAACLPSDLNTVVGLDPGEGEDDGGSVEPSDDSDPSDPDLPDDYPPEDDEEEAPSITPLPKEAVKDHGDGCYKFRSHKVQAASFEEAWRLLDDAFQEEQKQTARVQRLAKREKRRAMRSIEVDALQRPGALTELRPPSAAYTEVFRGRLTEDEHRVTFIQERTWITVVVEKDALRNNQYKRAWEVELREKLYLAVRAEHAKAKQRRQAEKKKHLQAEQLPKTARDLEVKKKECTGHLRYAYNGFEVLVTPRRHREKRDAEGR